MSLRRSYSLLAPFYDALLSVPTRQLRRRSLEPLASAARQDVLLAGVGTGLDLPHLPSQHRYVGLDLTPAMLRRARARSSPAHLRFVQGDAQRLPFADASFDVVVLHLILAVVPEPSCCLAEAARVLRPGGSVLVLDKFLLPGERALWKRAVNIVSRHIATRLDVVFEEIMPSAPELVCQQNEPALAGGWFRFIRLRKAARKSPAGAGLLH